MNPYDVLGVPSDATASQIKAAYRKAVKKHHPDATKVADTTMVAMLNEAYELLSDPQKKLAYDTMRYGVINVIVEDDPRAVYKKEFLRRKQAQAEARLAKEKRLFRRLYKCNILLAVLSLILIVDEILPTLEYQDMPTHEWIDNMRGKRMHFYMNNLETLHFDITISQQVSYEYELDDPHPIRIEASPIFQVPTQVEIPVKDGVVEFEPLNTLYSYAFPFHYALLFFSGFTISFREYSPMTFSFSFGPPVLAMMMIFFLLAA
jgi:hypothetical protein